MYYNTNAIFWKYGLYSILTIKEYTVCQCMKQFLAEASLIFHETGFEYC